MANSQDGHEGDVHSCLIPPLAPSVDVHTIMASASIVAPFRVGVSCVVFGYTEMPPAPSTNSLAGCAGASWPYNQLLHLLTWSQTALYSVLQSRGCSFRVLQDWFTWGTETKCFPLELKLSDSEVSPSWDYLSRIWT